MQRQQSAAKLRWQIVAALMAIAVLIWARALLWQAVTQLFFGMLVALAALPAMRFLEKRMSAGLAASLAMLSLSVTLIAALLLLVPTLIQQGKQLVALLPTLYAAAEDVVRQGQAWLRDNGVVVDDQLRSTLMGRGQELLGAAAPAAINWFGGVAGSMGQWMLAPVFAYYFLRDRRRIGQWLLSLVPVGCRELCVRILREMRRETAGYLRGQLMVSAVVGGLTAVGLLFCGVPAWLLLGAAMGVLELIPYVGPFLGGVLVALFSLPGGLSRTLWALGVVIVVQQLEGGMGGILLSVPLLLCARAALRVLSLRRPLPRGKNL